MEPTIEIGKLISALPYQQYHDYGRSINALRASFLKELMNSPAHLQYAMANPQEETEPLRQGKLIHSAFENPQKFLDTVTIEPIFEGYTQKGELTTSANCKEVKEKRAEWLYKLAPGAQVISEGDATMITGMLNAVSSHALTKNLLKNGTREVSGWVKDPATGLTLQFRPDFIHERGYVIDYKSTRCAQEYFFIGEIFSMRQRFYILAAAHYAYCTKLLGINKHDSFTFLAIEKKPPYGLRVYAMNQAHLDVGEPWRRKLTHLYAECLASNKWPSYDEKAVNPEIPRYAELPPLTDEFYGDEH